jgi:hypothetical protein
MPIGREVSEPVRGLRYGGQPWSEAFVESPPTESMQRLRAQSGRLL